MYVRLSEYISAAPNRRISMKFYTGDFNENQSWNSKFG
jgi:hypothetical protein